MKIYTYYEPIRPDPWDKPKGWWEQMISYWNQTWSSQGWTPVVLTLDHAQSHPDFQKINRRVQLFPTANPQAYELACWRRWCAFSMKSPCWVCDFDVMNYGWQPQAVPDVLTSTQVKPRGWSGSVLGGPVGDVTRWIKGYDPASRNLGGRPHACDLFVLDEHAQEMRWLGIEKILGEPGWETAPLVHYSGFACGARRVETIRQHILDGR